MSDIDAIFRQYTSETQSEMHHVLRSARRRLAIALLGHRVIRSNSHVSSGEGGVEARKDEISLSVRTLAREIVMVEDGVTRNHATGESYHNVYNSLIQTHLPQLDDINAIEYNHDRKKVVPSRNLIVITTVVATTSPVAQMLFHNATQDLHSEGALLSDATSDD